jgi:hypothetical protein
MTHEDPQSNGSELSMLERPEDAILLFNRVSPFVMMAPGLRPGAIVVSGRATNFPACGIRLDHGLIPARNPGIY